MSDELLVNTSTGMVHRPDCKVVTRALGSRWLAPWRGVARTPEDKPCRYCLPDGIPS